MLLFLFCFLQILINLECAPSFRSSSENIRCQVGHFFNGIDCSRRCNPLCQKCEGDADNCSECKPGNFLTPQKSGKYYYCKDDCNTDESRVEGKLYFLCSASEGHGIHRKCQDGSYLNNKKICKLCDSSCGTCSGPETYDCTSCKSNEFQIAAAENYGSFKCTKNCDEHSEEIAGKNYRFCGTSRELQPSYISNNQQRINEQPIPPNVFSLDWLHVLCIVLISNLAIAIGAFLYFKFRKRNEHFTLHSTQQYELTQTEPEEEIQIVTKDQINFGEPKKFLGRGTFGKVFKCTFTDAEGRAINVAVKVIDPIHKDADIESERQKIFDEFRSMMIPRHPYVIHLLGINMTDDLMLIMPLRKGCLQRYLVLARTPVPVNRLSRFCSQIADGMMHLHSHNVFHCDLKAANILIKDEFHIEICDFGLACPSIDDKGRYRGGTFSHLAIELLAPVRNKVFTQECDIWSYGVTVWEIYNLGRVKPYEAEGRNGNTIYEFLDNGGRLRKPDLLKSDAWPNILQCFAKNPEVRPKFAKLFKVFTQLANDKTPIHDETSRFFN